MQWMRARARGTRAFVPPFSFSLTDPCPPYTCTHVCMSVCRTPPPSPPREYYIGRCRKVDLEALLQRRPGWPPTGRQRKTIVLNVIEPQFRIAKRLNEETQRRGGDGNSARGSVPRKTRAASKETELAGSSAPSDFRLSVYSTDVV